MTLESAKIITRAIVWGTPIVWIAWDVFVFAVFGPEATESHYLWLCYLRRPWLAIAAFIAFIALYFHVVGLPPADPSAEDLDQVGEDLGDFNQ